MKILNDAMNAYCQIEYRKRKLNRNLIIYFFQ